MRITLRWKKNFINYIKNNFREYALVFLLFIIGIFVGVMIVNNCAEDQLQEISTYISDFVGKFKNIETLDKSELMPVSIKNNIFLALIIWLAGTTVIGIPIVLIVVLFRGICLGYTISIITYTLGTFKGIFFCLISLLFQNILFIPAILTLGVSSIKLYKSIVKDKRKDNIKVEIIKHTIISGLMILILIISSIIENIVSVPILQKMIKYF
jgi:stage II sporulation protein M